MDDKGRVQLSLKKVTEEEAVRFGSDAPTESAAGPRERADTRPAQSRPRRREEPGEDSFERKLKHFMRQSEDRLVDLKRSIESKRGVKRRKK